MNLDALKSALKKIVLPRGRRETGFTESDPLLIGGMFQTSNGIGRAAVGCFQALRKLGLDPKAIDLSAGFNQVDQDSPIPLSDPKPYRNGTVIIYANPPEIQRAMMIMGMRRWQNWRIIGAWVWELQTLPMEWQSEQKRVSEIWAPSHFVKHAFEAEFQTPTRVVPHFFSVQPPPRLEQSLVISRDNPFKILAAADGRSSFHRKNLIAAVDIFKAAFDEEQPAMLTLKVRNLSQFGEFESALQNTIGSDPRIHVLDQSIKHEDLLSVIANHHVLLSPHRSEGFGIMLAEAMAIGTIPVATNWSGNTDFMSHKNSILLPFKLAPVSDPLGIYARFQGDWAEVDKKSAATALKTLASDHLLRERLSSEGVRSIGRFLSINKYATALGAQAKRDY